MKEYEEYLEEDEEDEDDLIDLVLGDGIWTDPKPDESGIIEIFINENVSITALLEDVHATLTKNNSPVRIYIRDKNAGGKAGNISHHAPAIKAGRNDGNMVDIYLTKKGGVKKGTLDRKINPKQERELSKEIKLGEKFVEKNYDLLMDLWNAPDTTTALKTIDKLKEKNKEYSFSAGGDTRGGENEN